jgi:UDP-3-O-[3-hydroxymyristoyl] glucosamine N-acyltransferase
MDLRVSEIIDKLPVVEAIGDLSKNVRHVVSATAGIGVDDSIVWVSDKNESIIGSIQKGTVICSSAVRRESFHEGCTYLIVTHPRQYFASMVKTFFFEKEVPAISENAFIDSSAVIGKNAMIRAGVVIEKNSVIGDDCSIDSNTVIKKGTVIGNRVKIGANSTIGGDGFGYERDDSGQFEFIPHIGNVVIEDDVEIGNNTAIDRAVLGSTYLRRNVKVDNLVHIAHGVEIGENSLIIANAMVAGSTSIGKNVWVAPSASILNKLKVGDNALVGMGAVVVKNVEPSQTIVGNPGKDLATLKKKD